MPGLANVAHALHSMKSWLTSRVLLRVAVFLPLLTGAVWLFGSRPSVPGGPLQDGKLLTVEGAVNTEGNRTLPLGSGWQRLLARVLPPDTAARLGCKFVKYRSLNGHRQTGTLAVFTLAHNRPPDYRDGMEAVLVDRSGVEYPPEVHGWSQHGADRRGQWNWNLYPRSEASFRLRIYELQPDGVWRRSLDLPVQNPKPLTIAPTRLQQPERTRVVSGAVSLELLACEARPAPPPTTPLILNTSSGPVSRLPAQLPDLWLRMRLMSGGQPAPGWELEHLVVTDVEGNHATSPWPDPNASQADARGEMTVRVPGGGWNAPGPRTLWVTLKAVGASLPPVEVANIPLPTRGISSKTPAVLPVPGGSFVISRLDPFLAFGKSLFTQFNLRGEITGVPGDTFTLSAVKDASGWHMLHSSSSFGPRGIFLSLEPAPGTRAISLRFQPRVFERGTPTHAHAIFNVRLPFHSGALSAHGDAGNAPE